MTVAVKKDLLKAGAERLGMLDDGCFGETRLPKPAILLPSAPTAPSLLLRQVSQQRKQTDCGAFPSLNSSLSCTKLVPSHERVGWSRKKPGAGEGQNAISS